MSLTIGLSNPAAVTIGGKTAATINALSQAEADASAEALGIEKEESNQVRTGGPAQEESKAAENDDSLSIAGKLLRRRIQELQRQLQDLKQKLAAAQTASYPTPEVKAQVVMSMQGQVADTQNALTEAMNALFKEMAKGSGSGGLVNTTA